MKKDILQKYLSEGEAKFYKSILMLAINKIVVIEREKYSGVFPHLELLEIYNQFVILYRREGDEKLINIARLFRRAAHKIYRLMLKRKMTNKNDKFLNLV